ncbi:MAG: hypothetical protein ACI4UE_06500 [Candidatus Scatovivens sp.]
MENEDAKLYIPSNVKVRLEFFKGYGVKELISTIIVAIALIPISIIVYHLGNKNYLIPVLIEMFGVVATVVATTKDENNLCIVNQVKYMIDFAKSQKKYDYEYFDKWRC